MLWQHQRPAVLFPPPKQLYLSSDRRTWLGQPASHPSPALPSILYKHAYHVWTDENRRKTGQEDKTGKRFLNKTTMATCMLFAVLWLRICFLCAHFPCTHGHLASKSIPAFSRRPRPPPYPPFFSLLLLFLVISPLYPLPPSHALPSGYSPPSTQHKFFFCFSFSHTEEGETV